jgi:hypothetical protein
MSTDNHVVVIQSDAASISAHGETLVVPTARNFSTSAILMRSQAFVVFL